MHILRETAAQFAHAAILFSGGKDSLVLAALARKAFAPARPPFALLHIDTGHNFPETLAFRDRLAADYGYRLIVRSVQASIDAVAAPSRRPAPNASRNARCKPSRCSTPSPSCRLDAALGGGRRDEEKARAKERIFSHLDAFGQWDPKQLRPELWNLYNGRKQPGEHFRVFPLSNWTELDVWAYIEREKLPLPSLYFAHDREVFLRQGTLLAASPLLPLQPGETVRREQVRFRTVGDLTCTGAVRSERRHAGRPNDRGGRRRAADRTRYALRRPPLRNRNGGPETPGLFLTAPHGSPPAHHLRQR